MMNARQKLVEKMNDQTSTPEERELAEVLLEGIDAGKIAVMTEATTGELMFALTEEKA